MLNCRREKKTTVANFATINTLQHSKCMKILALI